jgi:hypothetical protein
MCQIVANLSVDCENFVSGSELSTFDGLAVGHNAFDEDSKGTAWTVSAADDGESKRLFAGTFFKRDS